MTPEGSVQSATTHIPVHTTIPGTIDMAFYRQDLLENVTANRAFRSKDTTSIGDVALASGELTVMITSALSLH